MAKLTFNKKQKSYFRLVNNAADKLYEHTKTDLELFKNQIKDLFREAGVKMKVTKRSFDKELLFYDFGKRDQFYLQLSFKSKNIQEGLLGFVSGDISLFADGKIKSEVLKDDGLDPSNRSWQLDRKKVWMEKTKYNSLEEFVDSLKAFIEK